MPVKFFEHPFAQIYVEKMLIFLPGLSLQGELFCVNCFHDSSFGRNKHMDSWRWFLREKLRFLI
jgi:hypothetical protein